MEQIGSILGRLSHQPKDGSIQVSNSDQSLFLMAASRIADACQKPKDFNPDAWLPLIAMTLSEFPLEIVDYVSDPRTGIAKTAKWVPYVSDVREACEEAMKPRRMQEEAEKKAAETKARRADQIHERNEWLSSQQDKNRVDRLNGEFQAEMKKYRDPNKRKMPVDWTPAEAEAILERNLANKNNPMEVSDTLKQKIADWVMGGIVHL
jgi:hypothetical protein